MTEMILTILGGGFLAVLVVFVMRVGIRYGGKRLGNGKAGCRAIRTTSGAYTDGDYIGGGGYARGDYVGGPFF